MSHFNLRSFSALADVHQPVDEELQKRLGLYQVFVRLYEQHRSLLDEILSLEDSGSKAFSRTALPYLQGVVSGDRVYLMTNLLQGSTQNLVQPQNTWVIGRDPTQVSLPISDKRLSRCHAALRYVEEQGFYLVDLNSSNGTFLNGERLRQPMLLKDGDQIRLGSMTLSFFLCNSSRWVNPVTDEMMNYIQTLDLATESRRPVWQASGTIEDLTESTVDPDPLEETSQFMRSPSLDSL